MASPLTAANRHSPEDRQRGLLATLLPDADHLAVIQQEFEAQLTSSLRAGKTTNASRDVQDIRAIDTCVKAFPTKKETGVFYVISIEMSGIRAARVTLSRETENDAPLASVHQPYAVAENEKGVLGDPAVTASVFASTVVSAVRALLTQENITEPVQFVIASCYFLDQLGSRAEFLHFEDICHEKTTDPLTTIDLIYLCNMHMAQHQLNATITAAISHTTAILLAAAYSISRNAPKCLMAVNVGESVSVSYVQPNARELGFTGEILDIDVAHFNGNHVNPTTFCMTYGLPYTVPDFEVDTISSPPDAVLKRSFENMTASTHLPELCRRLILRTFQKNAPASVWIPDSLPFSACVAILADSPKNDVTLKVIEETWDWKPTPEEVVLMKELVVAVFNRSAALVAMCIACIAKRTGRLQPALGGITVALSGDLAMNKYYQNLLRLHLDGLFHRDTSDLILFHDVVDGPLKGAALLCYMQNNGTTN